MSAIDPLLAFVFESLIASSFNRFWSGRPGRQLAPGGGQYWAIDAEVPAGRPRRGPRPAGRPVRAPHPRQPLDPLPDLDLVFPVLHGSYGEDGTMQGLLDTFDVPYVGVGVLAAAVCMDKDVCKRLLRDAGIAVVPYTVVTARQWRADPDAVRLAARALRHRSSSSRPALDVAA